MMGSQTPTGSPLGAAPGPASVKRSREAVITALHLLRIFADEGITQLLNRYLYDSDVEVSRAAIRAASLPGNTDVLPHLYQLIERSPLPIKIEAVGALAEIRDPDSVQSLIKYFSLFRESELKGKILETINTISPSHGRVSELNHGVLMDEKAEIPLKERAVKGLVRSSDYPFLSHYVPHAPPPVQEAVFSEIISGGEDREDGRREGVVREGDRLQISRFLKQLEERAGGFSPLALGLYLCAYFLKVRNPRNNFIVEALSGARKETHEVFFRSLTGMVESAASVKRTFRLLLLAPYRDGETERLLEELLERVFEFTRKRSPQAMSELMTLSVVYLENLYNKIRKDHLSLKGVKGRFDLLVVLFARLLERLAEEPLLAEITAFFKEERTKPPGPMIDRIKNLLKNAGEGDRKRFEACVPLFSETERLRRHSVYSALKNIQPETPNLVKRFHRVIKAVGSLRVRAVSKRVWEVLRFSQEERLHDLEAECILTLCQIGSKNILVEMRNRLNDPETGAEVKAALVRGARYLPPCDVVDPLLTQLFVPEGAGVKRAWVLETMREMDLSGMSAVPGAMLKLFSMNITEREKEIASFLLERYADTTLFQSLIALSNGKDPLHKRCAVRTLSSLSHREKGVPVDVLTHRLYLLLRDADEIVRIESLFALLDLNDDYAQKILKEWLSGERDEVRAAIIRRLGHSLPDDLLLMLIGLIRSESADIHRVLREALPGFCRDRFCGEVQRAVLAYLEAGFAGPEPRAAGRREDRVKNGETVYEKESLILQPKIEFKFRMEHSQVLTVFFIDVVDYTARSSRVDMSSLMQFVKTFEDTVIPIVEEYNGRVIKKLGDGILAAFLHPAGAVLASLAIQQEVKDHNRFAVEDDRFLVRIGLHTGSVIRKEGDIYGDVVNIASRMQQAAQPGMVLMTDSTHREVKDFIVGKSFGRIRVKGISDGVVAYAPERVRPEVAELLEIRKGAGAESPASGMAGPGDARDASAAGPEEKGIFLRLKESLFTPAFRIPREPAVPKEPVPLKEPAAAREILPILRGLFQDMSKAIEEIASDYHEEYVFKAYLQNKWEEILQKMNGRADGKGEGCR